MKVIGVIRFFAVIILGIREPDGQSEREERERTAESCAQSPGCNGGHSSWLYTWVIVVYRNIRLSEWTKNAQSVQQWSYRSSIRILRLWPRYYLVIHFQYTFITTCPSDHSIRHAAIMKSDYGIESFKRRERLTTHLLINAYVFTNRTKMNYNSANI